MKAAQPKASAQAATEDSLHLYRSRRDFSRTPEPGGAFNSSSTPARFVVQKHWATRLHYDFRLALDGTLKSWAVPKGPSMDPKDRRMAIQVEDHPLDYADFEGTIPPGQYGAGRVILWDSGNWVPLGDPREGLREGHLKFELQGHKLSGRWVLVRLRNRSQARQPAWLLIKEADPQARETLPGAVAAALPAWLSPQLATLVRSPPENPGDWLFEVKFDGYRVLTRVEPSDVQLFTRTGQNWTHRLPHLRQVLMDMGLPTGWYDGEIVVNGEHGRPDFGALQRALNSTHTQDIVYHLFDMPYANGLDLRGVPLQDRRQALAQQIEQAGDKGHRNDTVRVSAVFDAPPLQLLESACELGLEGVIGKRRDAPYRSTRNLDWIKLKCAQRQAFVVGGYTERLVARAALGALLLGVYDSAGNLRPVGKVGTGFTQQTLRELLSLLKPLRQAHSPFIGTPPVAQTGMVHWVAPRLVAEVSFAQWTRNGQVRQAVFHGLRDDKVARAIVRVEPQAAPQDAHVGRPVAQPAQDPSRRMTPVPITHPERVVDPQSGTTKQDLVNHYDRVSALMVPHLKGRPVSLLRAPEGIEGELFFQKHANASTRPGLKRLDPALDPGHAPLIEVGNRTSLLAAAQWNVLEFHTQNVTAQHPAQPDRLVFDLDPGAGVDWAQVREAAELTRAFLGELGLVPFLKTSGGKGLHVVVPLRRQHDAAAVKDFSRSVVQHMSRTIPQRFVAKSGPDNRVGKVFIDYLRNGTGATTVCAWSARARPGLGVSVPVAWSELPGLRSSDHWRVDNLQERLLIGNTPWRGYARSARALNKAIRMLANASGMPR